VGHIAGVFTWSAKLIACPCSLRARAFAAPPVTTLASGVRHIDWLGASIAAVGVGIMPDNPDSVSSVFCVHGTSWNNKRPAGVADSLQVRKHSVEFHADDSSNVFSKHPSGSCLRDNAEHFRPERTVICRASALPSVAERLARKSPCDEIDSIEVVSVKAGDVAPDWDSWEILGENSSAVGFDLAEADGSKSSPSSGQSKPSDSTEKIKVGRLRH
jgi:hypothetical protein